LTTLPVNFRMIGNSEVDRKEAAVEFGMWQGDREILTTALGRSMTEVPAATNMHYRIGAIAETFYVHPPADAGGARPQ
jgi:hypothetical protein